MVESSQATTAMKTTVRGSDRANKGRPEPKSRSGGSDSMESRVERCGKGWRMKDGVRCDICESEMPRFPEVGAGSGTMVKAARAREAGKAGPCFGIVSMSQCPESGGSHDLVLDTVDSPQCMVIELCKTGLNNTTIFE